MRRRIPILVAAAAVAVGIPASTASAGGDDNCGPNGTGMTTNNDGTNVVMHTCSLPKIHK